MTIEMWLGIALFISLALNALLMWLTINQSRRLLIISENINDLLDIIDNYRDHLKKVHSLDAFYGDETLQFLMEHTRSLIQLLGDQYGDVISLTEEIEYETEEIEYETEKELEIEENEENETTQEKDVFYAGSRKRNS